MIHIFQLVAIGLLSGLLGIGYAVEGQAGLAVVCVGSGIAWAAIDWFGIGRAKNKPDLPSGGSQKRKRGGDPLTDTLALLLFVALAAWGVWNGLPPLLMLIVVLLTLTAWDLGRFSFRLLSIIDENAGMRLERIHLNRLGLSLAIGLLLGGIALFVHISLDFGWALVIGVLAMVALNRFVRGLSG